MPWWLLIPLGAGTLLLALKRKPGALAIAALDNSPVGPALGVNVVWDGTHWRPTGSVDLAAVQAWAAARLAANLGSYATVLGEKFVWDANLAAFV